MINFLRISAKIIFFIQSVVIIVVLSFSNFYAQEIQPKTNPLQGNVVFGLDGGITYPQTDYQKVQLGFNGRAQVEYFFNTHSIHLPGLKLKIGYDQLTGEDTRGRISSPDAEEGYREIPTTFRTNIFSAGFAVTYCIAINDAVFPYVSGGISNLWFDPKDDQGNPGEYNSAGKYKKSAVAYTLELGLKVKLSDKVSLNFSANPSFPKTDYLDDVAAAYINDSYSTMMVGITLTPFYSSDYDGDGVDDALDKCPDTPAGVIVDEFGCPVDSDKDGVPDYIDKCPDTPIGIAVDQNGCPLDSDGDGVEDAIDKCPDTPTGVKVDKFGCPMDSDKDGVPDYLDECPETPQGTVVDQKGCPINETSPNKFTLPADEIFSPNSAMIKVDGKKYLDEVISHLQKFPDQKWRIEGHMDSNGNKRLLRSLSLERAKAVLEYFTYFGGLKRENFQVFGMGDNFPVSDNNTEEGRAKNRRILIIKEK